jgi:DNA-binding CsgD family transcriptional regulator
MAEIHKDNYVTDSVAMCDVSVSEAHPSRIYVSKKYPHVYFTERELECASELVKNKNNREIAKSLKLSALSVEFYLDNLKMKLKCYERSELINKVLSYDLNLNFAEINK